MAPNMRILIWVGACIFLLVDPVHGEEKCVFPFIYKGKKYFDCTMYDSVYNWCSLEAEFSEKWKYCKKDDYAQCRFPFIYKGKSYDSCTADGSVVAKAWCSLSPNYDMDRSWKNCF